MTGDQGEQIEGAETGQATAARTAADVAIAMGDLREGYERTLDELRIRSEKLEAQGRRWELDLALVSVLARAGSLATDLGRLAEAENHLVMAAKATGLARKAYPGFDSDRTWEVTRNRLGRLALLKGDSAGAVEILADVLARRRGRRFLEPNRNQSLYDIAVTLSFLALARLHLGEAEAAVRLCGEAVFLLKRLVYIDWWRAAARLEMAWALVVQNAASGGTGGHLARARQLLEEIWDYGERDEKLWRVMKEAGMPVPGTEGGALS